MSELSIVQTIRTSLLRKGRGTPQDPIRIIDQWWDMEGNLILEHDPSTGDLWYLGTSFSRNS